MEEWEILSTCIAICKADNHVKRLILFGSLANGTDTPDSDIDLCLDTSYAARNNGLFALCSEISRACRYNCDILQYSLIGGRIKREIDKNGIVLYDATLKYKGYAAVMEYSPADQMYVGQVEGIADYIAFHGKTPGEGEASFHQVIDDYKQIRNDAK